ncbi:MAG: Fur family transcriptional regulator [Persicimonas sp.]
MTTRRDIESGRQHDAQQLEEGLERLRARGCRLTPQRRAILAIFGNEPQHLTPQQVYDRLEDSVPSLSLATVYNTLELFEEVDLVKRVVADDGQTYFDSTLQPHHHAVCSECGEIFDVCIESDSLDRLMKSSRSLHEADDGGQFRVEKAEIWLRGICADCQD